MGERRGWQIDDTDGPHRWSEFVRLPKDDRRELIAGELVEVDGGTESEVNEKLHEYSVAMLIFFLAGWARETKTGYVLASGYKVRISDRTGFRPDVQFLSYENRQARGQLHGMASGCPDLVIEVLSPTSNDPDRVTKLNDYLAIGIVEYWIVDPDERTLEQFVMREGRYVIVSALADNDAFRPETFPGLEIPLSELWLEAPA